jgi:protein-tyrosine phosphatase
VGEPPDARAIAAAARRGIDLRGLRARQVHEDDFEGYDLIVAMDRLNQAALLERSPAEFHPRIRLFMEFASSSGVEDVPDPYYGGPLGFEQVLDLAEEASLGLLEEVQRRMQSRRRR